MKEEKVSTSWCNSVGASKTRTLNLIVNAEIRSNTKTHDKNCELRLHVNDNLLPPRESRDR